MGLALNSRPFVFLLLCIRLEGVSCEKNLKCEGIGGACSLAGYLPELLVVNYNAANGEGMVPALSLDSTNGSVELGHFDASEIMFGEGFLDAHYEKYACVTCASFFKCFFRNTFDLFHSLPSIINQIFVSSVLGLFYSFIGAERKLHIRLRVDLGIADECLTDL